MSQHAACRQSSQSSGQFPDPLDSRKASSTFRVCRGAGDPCTIRSASGRRCQLQHAVAAHRLCSLPLRRTAPAAMGSMAAMRSPRSTCKSARWRPASYQRPCHRCDIPGVCIGYHSILPPPAAVRCACTRNPFLSIVTQSSKFIPPNLDPCFFSVPGVRGDALRTQDMFH
jgi:hypothetical protein